MSARRLPIITLALIIINVGAFFLTHDTIEKQAAEVGEVQKHMLMLAAMHPDLTMPEDAQHLVNTFHEHNEQVWTYLQDGNRKPIDAWDARMRMVVEPSVEQEEMDSLTSQYSQIAKSALTEQYAFIPAVRKPITYVTANFLHVGWLHLIGNMWFLWLAGFILEDAWGRTIYTIIYFLAGAAALQFHLWMNPGSITATLGASGAVAALMGAFVVRFPTLKIEMGWLLTYRLIRFKAPAYWLLPLWLATEVFSGALFGQSSGVAHWAHVGGFAFGAGIAMLLKVTGIEHKLDQAIESKVSLSADQELLEIGETLQSNVAQALPKLQNYVKAHPDSIDGCLLLQQAYSKQNEIPAYQETVLKLCGLHLKAHDTDAALQDYDDFLKSGGKEIPAALWLDLARALETKGDFERAVQEYGYLAAAYPTARQSLVAQINAARVCLAKLRRAQEALNLYEAAEKSPVPHLDFDQTIEKGKREAMHALSEAAAVHA
jgi:membrane associated rhomboid family serine protease